MNKHNDADSERPTPPAERADDARQTLIGWAGVGGLAVLALVLGLVIVARVRRVPEPSQRTRPAKDVVVWRITPRDLVDDVRLPGTVQARDSLWVMAQVAGEVVSVKVEPGRKVEKGDPLCHIDERDYKAAADQAQAAVAQASAGLRLARLQLARMKKLQADGAIGKAQFDVADAAVSQAEAAREQATAARERASLALERTIVRAPLSGVVSEVPVSVGTVLAPRKNVARIVDSRKVKVVVGIPERDVLAVRGIKEVDISFSAIPGRQFTGRKTYLGVETEPRARVYRLELEVDNFEGLIRPGMLASTTVIRGIHRDAILVPLFAVIPRERDRIVFLEEDGVARRRVVETGILIGAKIEDAKVEITKGLRAGENLIVLGQRQVEDGDPVVIRETPEAMKELMK